MRQLDFTEKKTISLTLFLSAEPPLCTHEIIDNPAESAHIGLEFKATALYSCDNNTLTALLVVTRPFRIKRPCEKAYSLLPLYDRISILRGYSLIHTHAHYYYT